MDAGFANLLYLIPNVQMNIGGSNISLIKCTRTQRTQANHDVYQFYFTPEMIELAASVKDNSEIQDASNVYDEMDPDMAPGEEVALLEAITEVFSSTIADQDYDG